MTSLPPMQFAAGPRQLERRSVLGTLAWCIAWVLLLGISMWAVGALWYDFPIKGVRRAVAIGYAVVSFCVLLFAPGRLAKTLLISAGFGCVLGWWFTLQPSNTRPWQRDVEHTAWAVVRGDRVMLRYTRNADYQTETMYAPKWQTRIVDLGELTGYDIAITYWGSPHMAHPIISFQFKNAPPVCFSIETRKEEGESYSAIGGFYRQYELVYVCATERDVIQLRTNYRKGEDVYLYRANVTPAAARERFMDYVRMLNELHERPRWYNAATTNCTTAIRAQHDAGKRAPFDWRMLVNGYMDEMLYEHGVLAGGLPFPELKAKARINDAARAANDAPDFSRRIRAGRPGFESSSTANPPTL